MGRTKRTKTGEKTRSTAKLRRAPPPGKEHLESVLDLSSEWHWEQDEHYRFTQLTGKAFGKAGFDPEDFLGKTRWDRGACPVGDGGRWENHRAALAARQTFTDFVYTCPHPHGGLRYISSSGGAVFDDQGRFRGYRGVARNVTRRIQRELRLMIEHGVTRILAESNGIAEAAAQVIRVICETLGWSCGARWESDRGREAIRCAETWGIASTGIDAFLEATRRLAPSMQLEGLNRRSWTGGEPLWIPDVTQETTFRRAPDAVKAGLHSAFAFPIKIGAQVIGVMEFFSREIHQPDAELLDCTTYLGSQIGQFMQRARAEEQQRESEARFGNLTALSSDFFWETDTEHRLVQTHYGAGHRPVIPAPSQVGKARWELPSTRPDAAGWAAHRATLEAHLPFHDFEFARIDADGVERHLSISGEPVFDAAGAFKGYRGIGKDISIRKREEQLLKLEHTVTRSLAEADSAPAALEAAIRAVCETQSWECGRYFGADHKAGVLRFGVAWGVPTEAVQRFIEGSRNITYTPGVGLIGQVWQSGQPLWVTDIAKDSRIRKGVARDAGMHGAFLFPVVSDAKTIGVLVFHSREVREPDERLLQAIRVIGSQIGQFVQRKQAEEVLRESEERFRSLTQLSSDMYWEQDDQYRFVSIAGTGSEAINVRGPQLLGKKRWEQEYVNMSADDWAAHMALLDARQPFRDLELCRLDDAGDKVWISVSGEPIFDPSGVFTGYRGVGRDITARKNAEERIQYLATHDGLTELPNRVMFSQVLNLAIQSARRYERRFAVLFLDLDRFKIINDTLGHEAGDILLKEMARRIKESLRASDVVARLGGDEFVVLLQEVTEPEQVATVARKLLSTVIKPVVILGQECRVTASIGISTYPADAQDEQALMKNADVAMYLAKEEGKNNFQFFSKDIKAQSLERLTLETSLRRALERQEFFLHYQAKLDLKTGAITGVEALLRWQHPDLGLVSPAQFIPLAEETGLIVPIGRWVLKTACAQNVAWQRAGLPPVCIAVNLSPRQFADENLLNDLAAALEETGMAPELLELEITESMVMGNVERAAKQLGAIKQMGARLAIDDFGTGYSSLAQIKRFPIDTLKVDRSFIREIPQDAEDRAITQAIIAMGKTLSLTVVAEGVETEEQETFLREHACNEMQGYYFSKPIAPEQFAELLSTHVPGASPQM